MHLKLGTADQVQGLKTRLKDKLLRRHSGSPASSASSQESTKQRTNAPSSIHTHDSRPRSGATDDRASKVPSSPSVTTEDDIRRPSSGGTGNLNQDTGSPQASPRAGSRSWELTVDDDDNASQSTPDTRCTPQTADSKDNTDDVRGDEGAVPGSAGQTWKNSGGVTRTSAAAVASTPSSDQHLHQDQDLPPRAPQQHPPTITEASSTIQMPTTPLPSIHEDPADTPSRHHHHTRSLPPSDPDRLATAAPAVAIALATPSTPSTPATPIHSRRGITLHDSNNDDTTPKRLANSHLSALADSPLSVSSSLAADNLTRTQSLVSNRQTALIKSLLQPDHAGDIGQSGPDTRRKMVARKIWVKRPLASATLVTITEDDLVDDVRDMILRKYTNSLGRQFDAPDLVIRMISREPGVPARLLAPDEPICRLIETTYPGGQTVDEALLIDIPSRARTPKASPNPRFYNDDRPHESGTDYFPPYPATTAGHIASHGMLQPGSANTVNGGLPYHSMSVVNGNPLPLPPSPGGRLARVPAATTATRPRMIRGHTASPIAPLVNGHSSHPPTSGAPQYNGYNTRPSRSRTHSGASSDHSNIPHVAPTAQAPAIPSPPAPERVTGPPPRVSSPRPATRLRKGKKLEKPTPQASLPAGMPNGGVPPINVLIVEDNIINLKLLEAFVKRLKVRWQTAMNGRDAVTKWRTGGFHLVLMDIQLPIMNGLDATREIRRLEKVNSIGVFSSSASSAPEENHVEPEEVDKLSNTEMFKSPVIIVALTASSLQSDRHEALAAGCNDFLTKPVNFGWLEKKVLEWGCMQALIDFDGWRKWKDFSQKAEEAEAAKKAASATAKAKKQKEKNRLQPVAAA